MLRWPRDVAQVEFSLSNGGTAPFSIISENITINHTLLKTRSFGVQFIAVWDEPKSSHCDVA